METNTIDELVKSEGEILDTEKYVVEDAEKVVSTLKDDDSSSVKLESAGDSYSYVSRPMPLPGQAVKINTDNVITDKATANQEMIKRAALMKLDAEKAKIAKMSDDEKVRTYVIGQCIKQQENSFVEKYGYEMSGQQKRTTRKKIESAYAKGRLKVSKKEREDILYMMSLSSSQKDDGVKSLNSSSGTAQSVAGIMSAGI